MSKVRISLLTFLTTIYGGRQVIQPEQLVERDSTKLALPYGTDGSPVPIQKFRDVQKLYAAMTDGKAAYVLYGAENQSDIHYAMAVKNNLYDALDYAGQVEEIAKSHRRAMKHKSDKKAKAPSSGEFLSGFWKDDRLIPSITVTIFFGAEEWDGPLSLLDMMDVSDPAILACLDNYHVRLISPVQMADEDIMKFQSSLREVMLFIKYSKDLNKLNDVLQSNESRFQNLERRAADVIEAITNSGLKYAKDEVKVDMCKAIQDMKQASKLEGKLEGKQEGKLEVAKQMKKMGFDTEKIAQVVNYPVEVVNEWLSN